MTSKGTLPRSFRVPSALWEASLAAAERRGTTRTAVLVQALEQLVARDEAERTFTEGLTSARTDQGDTDR